MANESADHGREARWDSFGLITDARNALGNAWIRCESSASLIEYLAEIPDPANYYVCRALSERDLTAEERDRLATQLAVTLSDEFRARVRSRMRPKLDRVLLHCLPLLTPSDARELAHSQLLHKRPARRLLAIRVLHRIGVIDLDFNAARQALIEHQEIQAVTILACIPGGMANLDCCSLIGLCDEDVNPPFGDHSYTGAIALEGLARSNSLDHEHACTAHPLYYIRAAGRLKDPGLASYIKKGIEIGGVAVWPMAVSVAGRLQLVELLTHLEGEIQRKIVEDPELYGPWIRE
ncbi:hypothetical protein ACQP2P_11500 [Dactylosporangium sp. CA-139114]|uniref:hypothetical protein n=1 Tax=Dactylosporangium sp. CA-139114 TaxID=3239931 RepID=UPI003D974298